MRRFPIATNPDRFHDRGRPIESTWDWVFTGSLWGAPRDVMVSLLAMPETLRGAIFGRGWPDVPVLAQWDKGFVPYTELPEVYRQAAIVVGDANHATKPWGAANSRVFDALAAGCLVITHSSLVSDELFDGHLPVYGTPGELADLLECYAADDIGRAQLVARLRAVVLEQHVYSQRAFELAVQLSFLVGRKMKGVGDPTV